MAIIPTQSHREDFGETKFHLPHALSDGLEDAGDLLIGVTHIVSAQSINNEIILYD